MAVDLGASSGRVFVGQRAEGGGLDVREIRRFTNSPVTVAGTLHWDILGIYREVLSAVREAGRQGVPVHSISIDSWAVDYGLLDRDGVMIANPVHYRDARTEGVSEAILAKLGAGYLYQRSGIAALPFNTMFQLAASAGTAALESACRLLMIPDLLAYWMTGQATCEVTNASTTGLVSLATQVWDVEVIDQLGIDVGLFAPLVTPGTSLGPLRPEVAVDVGLGQEVEVVAVGSHDTASAVAGIPASGGHFAYISSGTWSLVGLELTSPVVSEASRLAGFTNEVGVDGTYRFLRNVMGLWLLQECEREWERQGWRLELDRLLEQAGTLPARRWLVDCNDQRFLPPGGMTARIRAACRSARARPDGADAPEEPAELTRCILDSLALAYRRALRDAITLSGHPVEVIHLVGGGSRNSLLCQLTADACGVPVVAGPVEAAAAGNLIVQARAAGWLRGSLGELRALQRAQSELVTYAPSGNEAAWEEAERRLGER